MPQPKKNEKESKYISRAIKYMVTREGLSKEHATAKAYGMWKQAKKG